MIGEKNIPPEETAKLPSNDTAGDLAKVEKPEPPTPVPGGSLRGNMSNQYFGESKNPYNDPKVAQENEHIVAMTEELRQAEIAKEVAELSKSEGDITTALEDLVRTTASIRESGDPLLENYPNEGLHYLKPNEDISDDVIRIIAERNKVNPQELKIAYKDGQEFSNSTN